MYCKCVRNTCFCSMNLYAYLLYLCTVFMYSNMYLRAFSHYSFLDGYLELRHTMKIPVDILHKNPINRAYKYFVTSPATIGGAIHSFEFIAGVKTRRGGVINRSLKLHAPLDKIYVGG